MTAEPGILAHLLTSPADTRPIAGLVDFAERVALLPGFASTIDRAAAAGFLADRLGYAFAGGYQAALVRLVPEVRGHACLAATEPGGAHPRFIKTRLAEKDGAWRLDGAKTWVTLGTEADELLVVASTGEENGKNRLKVVHLPAKRAGVVLVAKAPAPFAPEIPHSEAVFSNVEVQPHEILPGDGYDAYLKPFRTIEDAHVVAAALGYLLRVARLYTWPHAIVEEALATILALRAIGAADASANATHIALAGALQIARRVLASSDAHWESASDDERARWTRDRAILDVAEKVRALRLASAWTATRAG